MSELKINTEELIKAYNKGESLNAIARAFGTYATTVKRILEKNGVELRHDTVEKGSFTIKNGEKLIEWAKAQGRLVTKTELAEVIGRKRLSPSYFLKYPELGQYITTRQQKELKDYSQKLYKWLKENNIPFKPNDRTQLGVSLDALLLDEYKGIGIQMNIRPSHTTKKYYADVMKKRLDSAEETGLIVILLDKKRFENLTEVKKLLDDIKNSRRK